MKDVTTYAIATLFFIALATAIVLFSPNHNKEYAVRQRSEAAQACSQAGGILMFDYADGEMRFKTCTFVPGAVRQ